MDSVTKKLVWVYTENVIGLLAALRNEFEMSQFPELRQC